jgi:DNA topoisomerase-1
MIYLLITESPAKAKKIQTFLTNDYTVKSSCGHIRDLEKKQKVRYGNPLDFGIDVENDFKPTYKIMTDKKDIVKMLKQNAEGKKVIFAADDDREGEAIAWHTAHILKQSVKDKNRIVFREISKKAILNSLKNPKQINMNEVNAQQARRIIDRLIGFKLSPCLWKHIDTHVMGLSAGRVQSSLLNMILEKEEEIENYEGDIILEIKGDFEDIESPSEFNFIDDFDIDNDFIKDLFKDFSKDRIFKVKSNKVKKEKRYPNKPLITTSLQKTAQRELGLSVEKTMNIAQKLYDDGHITYMRTDSTFVSEEFQEKIKKHMDDISGEGYYNKPNEKKVKGAQEAHEAIRPTSINKNEEITNPIEKKLYDLIYDKTMISHMKPAEYDSYTLKLVNANTSEIGYFKTKYNQLTFPGYLSYKNEINIDDKPLFSKEYKMKTCISNEYEESPPSNYNESSIVDLLEKTGIGRPSTYSSIISTLYNRNYTIQEDIVEKDIVNKCYELEVNNNIREKELVKKGKTYKKCILLTQLGKLVLIYLREHFTNILRKEFTAEVELDLDKISSGKLDYISVIRKVYDMFNSIVGRQLNIKTIKTSGLKKIGDKRGCEIFISKGPYGAYINIKKGDKGKNTSIQKYLELINKDVENVSFDEVLDFLKYPKKITNEIVICIGPYGYYMKYNGRNYKINQSGNYSEDYCKSLIK